MLYYNNYNIGICKMKLIDQDMYQALYEKCCTKYFLFK